MKYTLEDVNKRLKAGKIGVSVIQRGDRLSLRATFPPKPRVDKPPHQQYLALGIYANTAGFQEAEAQAKIIGGKLAKGDFDWSEYLKPETEDMQSCGYWIEKFRQEYFAINGESRTKSQGWKLYYQIYFRKLPADQPLTSDILIATAITLPANSQARLYCCQKFGQLAKFAGVEVRLTKYRGKYASTPPDIKQLPSEAEIIAAREKIPNPQWRWLFGVVACYGIRPHEAFYAEVSDQHPYCCEISAGKTGPRTAYPLPLEWAIEWRLWENNKPADVGVDGKTFREVGRSICRALWRYKIGFSAYKLRHAYAIRAGIKHKLPVATTAKWMGHSPEIHLKIYNHHITEADHLEIYNRLVAQKETDSKDIKQ